VVLPFRVPGKVTPITNGAPAVLDSAKANISHQGSMIGLSKPPLEEKSEPEVLVVLPTSQSVFPR
jgi:hypothetical protein